MLITLVGFPIGEVPKRSYRARLEIELPLIRGYVGSNPTLSANPLYHTPVITTSITTHLQRLLGVSSLRLAAMWPPAVVVRITELYIDMNDTVVKCRS